MLTALLQDPTFGVLVAFVLFLILACKRVLRALNAKLDRVQQNVTAHIQEADDMLTEAQKELRLAQKKGSTLAKTLTKIDETTIKQLSHIRANRETQQHVLEEKYLAIRKKQLEGAKQALQQQLLKETADAMIQRLASHVCALNLKSDGQKAVTQALAGHKPAATVNEPRA